MPDTTPSNHFEPFTRDALVRAGLVGDSASIDAITDELARQGVCRPRDDMSRMAEWIARRPEDAQPIAGGEALLAEAAVDSLGDIGSQLAAHFRGIFAGAAQ